MNNHFAWNRRGVKPLSKSEVGKAVLLIIFLLYVTFILYSVMAISRPSDENMATADNANGPSTVSVSLVPYQSLPSDLDHGRVGYISFVDKNSFGCKQIIYIDEGYDGVLDQVVVTRADGKQETIIFQGEYDPLEQRRWEARYQVARSKASHGPKNRN